MYLLWLISIESLNLFSNVKFVQWIVVIAIVVEENVVVGVIVVVEVVIEAEVRSVEEVET